MPEQVKQLIPLATILGMWVLFFVAKLLIDRWRNYKAVQHKLQVMLLHRAGQPDIILKEIESIGGESCIQIKTKNNADPIVHILGAPGEFPWIYPLGKPAFVQASVQGIIFDENDTEPLSNTTTLPVISAHSFGRMAQSISLATGSAMQKSEMDETPEGQQRKQKSGLRWVYVGLIVVAIIGIIGIAISAKNNETVVAFMNLLKTHYGIK